MVQKRGDNLFYYVKVNGQSALMQKREVVGWVLEVPKNKWSYEISADRGKSNFNDPPLFDSKEQAGNALCFALIKRFSPSPLDKIKN